MLTLSQKPMKGNHFHPAEIPGAPMSAPAAQPLESFTPAIRRALLEAGRALGN